MEKKSFRVTNEIGIHAKTATMLVNLTMKFDCDINLTALKKTVDFKSIMGVMSLGIYSGTDIVITCDGDDEKEAIEAIKAKIIELGIGKEI